MTAGSFPAVAQMVEGQQLVQAALVSDVKSVQPGDTFYVALHLRHAPGWHTYWRFPGDSGLATAIKWDLPEGVEAGPILWPVPRRLIEPGDLHVYAYKEEVYLLTEFRVSDSFQGGSLPIKARADWLVCEKICVPGNAELELELAVGKTSEPSEAAETVAQWLARVPPAVQPPFDIDWSATSDNLTIKVSGLETGAGVEFFPLPGEDIIPGHVEVTNEDGSATVNVPIQSGDASGMAGVLAVTSADGTRKGWEISSTATAGDGGSPAVPVIAGSLWTFLIYGFIGGFILNLMPCVLPVISLKVFGFIRQAGDSPGRIFKMGLTFVAGIFTWFLGLAALIAIMKNLGREVTWAFQFQNPWFILTMSLVVFVFALNLFGVFEVMLPGRAGTQLSEAGDKEGAAGVYFQGVFATILATPCTAPFLGTALAFAFAQSTAVIFLMFGSIALGMGFPYLVLTARPAWMRFLPRPGMWMDSLKQFMGFLLIATLLWLLWILGNQGGVEAVIWTGAFLLIAAIFCWVLGVFLQGRYSASVKWITGVLALLLLVLGGWFFIGSQFVAAVNIKREAGVPRQTGGIPWEKFSPERVAEEQDRIVFVDFTAEWCLTCKFNERTALETATVRAWLEEHNVLPLKADWTNSDPVITKALAEFGRVGVPFYIIYPAGRKADPIVLPELLTETIVLRHLREALALGTPASRPVPAARDNPEEPETQ